MMMKACRPGRTYTSRLRPRPAGFLAPTPPRHALVVEQTDPDAKFVEVWVAEGKTADGVSVHLDAEQCVQLAHDLVERTTLLAAPKQE